MLLRLSVDPDSATSELFRDLTTQMIHWGARNASRHSHDIDEMVDCLLLGVGGDDGVVRSI